MKTLKSFLNPSLRILSFLSRRTVSVVVQAPTFKATKRISLFLGKRLPKKSILEAVIFCSCVVYPPEKDSSEKTFSAFLYDNRGKILAYALGTLGVSLAIYVLAVKVQRSNFLMAVIQMDPFYHASTFRNLETGRRIHFSASDLVEYGFYVHDKMKKWTPEFLGAANIMLSTYNATMNDRSYLISAKEMDTILLFLANMKK